MRVRLESIDLQIRRGQIASAAQALREIPIAELTPALLPRFAALARRANLVSLSLKALAPSLRGERAREATPEEKLEYAAGLLRIGVRREAIETLSQLDLPMARLHLAFGHFARWEYAAAIPHLEDFITAPTLTDYQRLIGRVNLAAAFAATHDYRRTRDLTADLLQEAADHVHARIRANLHEIRAQIEIAEGDLASAALDLAAAAAALGTEAPDALFIRKWQAVASGDPAVLRAFREQAAAARDGESVREADFFLLRLKFEENTFHQLWFGTPHPAYRARIERALGRPTIDVYRWGDGPRELDLTRPFKQPALQRVLLELTRDLYRPAPLGSLFENVFPEERFDIFSSPNRLHQLLWRVRGWLARERLPLAIENMDGTYQLVPTGRLALVLPGGDLVTGAERDWQILRERLGGRRTFRVRDVAATLGVSKSSALRLLQWAEATQGLLREGRGRAVTYRITG